MPHRRRLGITSVEASAAIDFLKYRRGQLRSIIDRTRAEFRAIQHYPDQRHSLAIQRQRQDLDATADRYREQSVQCLRG